MVDDGWKNVKMPWEISERAPVLKMPAPMSPRRAAGFMHNFGGKCYYCKRQCLERGSEETLRPTRDHYLPKIRGGGKGTNIVLCCVACNRLKSDMTGDEFKHFMETGELAPSYIAWLTKKTRMLAAAFLIPIGDKR